MNLREEAVRMFKGIKERNKSYTFWLKNNEEFYTNGCRRCDSVGKALTWRSESNPKHELGKVPKAVLITQNDSASSQRGGIKDGYCIARPTLSTTPTPGQSNNAATSRIQGIRASRESALLMCGPGVALLLITTVRVATRHTN